MRPQSTRADYLLFTPYCITNNNKKTPLLIPVRRKILIKRFREPKCPSPKGGHREPRGWGGDTSKTYQDRRGRRRQAPFPVPASLFSSFLPPSPPLTLKVGIGVLVDFFPPLFLAVGLRLHRLPVEDDPFGPGRLPQLLVPGIFQATEVLCGEVQQIRRPLPQHLHRVALQQLRQTRRDLDAHLAASDEAPPSPRAGSVNRRSARTGPVVGGGLPQCVPPPPLQAPLAPRGEPRAWQSLTPSLQPRALSASLTREKENGTESEKGGGAATEAQAHLRTPSRKRQRPPEPPLEERGGKRGCGPREAWREGCGRDTCVTMKNKRRSSDRRKLDAY